MTHTFVHESVIEAPVREVFAFHERPDALELLQPPWAKARIVKPPSSLQVGTRVILRLKVGPVPVTIEAEHVAYLEDELFEDVMRRGPFAYWHHAHRFLEHPRGCLLRDEVDYVPPLGILGRLVDPIAIRPQLERLFAYRHEVTRREVLAARQAA